MIVYSTEPEPDVVRPRWRMMGHPPDFANEMNAWEVTSDGCGRLFVCDFDNSCVHLISVDNVYLGKFLFFLNDKETMGHCMLQMSDA